MAVEKKFGEVSALHPAGRKAGNYKAGVASIVAIAAEDSNNSIYGVATLPGDAIITDIRRANTTVTGGTDYDLGIFRLKGDGTIGDVVSTAAGVMFSETADLSTARIRGAEVSAINSLSVANSNKTLRELAGDDVGNNLYAICWKANTVGTAAATLFTDITYITP